MDEKMTREQFEAHWAQPFTLDAYPTHLADYKEAFYEIWKAALSTLPRMTGWVEATEATNPKQDGDYLTVFRYDHWTPGHYIRKVCRFSVGNNCTGNMWGAQIAGCGEWNVKYWMPLPDHHLISKEA